MRNNDVLISLSLAASMLFLTSCGPKSTKKAGAPLTPVVKEAKEPQIEKNPELEPEMAGQFLALFETLNPVVSDKVFGAFTLSRDEDEFVGDVRFSGGPLTASVLHVQAVHAGERCPTEKDDLNQDGFIDDAEGEAVYGKVLIPLDGDLNAQHLELGTYPVADAFGGYVYSEQASFKKFLADLKEEDINPEDYLLKIDSQMNLRLLGKVVVIKGVSKEAQLPETVVSTSRFPNYQTLPIACGVIGKVTSLPGSIDRDLPQNPTGQEPGGPAGSDDGTIIIPPGTGGTDTGSTEPTVTGDGTSYGEEEDEEVEAPTDPAES